jgi:alcohol dehydrogenase class IV
MDFNFYMPVSIISGKNAVVDHAAQLRALGSSCLIVTGGHSAIASGAQSDLISALESCGVTYQIFNEIGPNPLLSACRKAGKLADSFDADFIVGVGGGSPLDAAKATAVFAANSELSDDDFYSYNWPSSPLPIVLIGTTSGTGSEVSAASVLTCDDGCKRSVGNLYAAISFADAKYTYSMSRAVTTTTTLDAFAHAVEGFLSPKCGDVITNFAQKAIPMLWDGLKKIDNGDEITNALHEQLYYASLWAGLVLNANGTSFPHPFGYILTEDFDIPHGRACTTFLPALLHHTQKNNPARVAELFTSLNCGMEELERVIVHLSDTADVKMTEEQIKSYLPRFVNLKHYANVYGGYDVKQAELLYRSLFLR